MILLYLVGDGEQRFVALLYKVYIRRGEDDAKPAMMADGRLFNGWIGCERRGRDSGL